MSKLWPVSASTNKHQGNVNVVRGLTGLVLEFITPFKAIIEFNFNGCPEKALLKKDSFVVGGRLLMAEDWDFRNVLLIGSLVKFVALEFDVQKPGVDNVGWYIIFGWSIDEVERMAVNYVPGIVNALCKIQLLTKRYGILSYETKAGGVYEILFLASKVYLFGMHINRKQSLVSQLELDSVIYCDAIPCDPAQNEENCSWFATIVWRGQKPNIVEHVSNIAAYSPNALQRLHRAITGNARNIFTVGQGQVMSIMSPEFGLAVLKLRRTQWQSVLFHRSTCTLNKIRLSNENLEMILKEGDVLRIIATATPEHYFFKWVACQITVVTDARKVDFKGNYDGNELR